MPQTEWTLCMCATHVTRVHVYCMHPSRSLHYTVHVQYMTCIHVTELNTSFSRLKRCFFENKQACIIPTFAKHLKKYLVKLRCFIGNVFQVWKICGFFKKRQI